MEHWGYWLNEPIFTEKGCAYAKRKHILYSFCMDGLIPFVEAAGYKFAYPDAELYKIVLTSLYYMYQGKRVRANCVLLDAHEEQHARFHQTLDSDAWMKFWEAWGSIQDFDTEGYAHRMQYEFAEFVWSWLDFEHSRTVQQVYEELDDDDYQEEIQRGKEDPYLQETSKRDYQDRHW